MPVVVGRLRRRSEFLRVAQTGRKFAAAGLVLQAAPSVDREMRVGFTVTRKVGPAVVRNRAKRRLRALAAEILPLHAAPGHDYVMIGRATTATRDFTGLRHDLAAALKRLKLWHDGADGEAKDTA